MTKLQKVASAVDARLTCIKMKNTKWEENHDKTIKDWLKTLPHGSGINSDYWFNFEKSTGEKLIFGNKFHVMNEDGYYEGHIPFTVKVTASLQFDIDILITGPFSRYQDLKEYLYQTYHEAFTEN